MPSIEDLLNNAKTKKRFQKSNYRPWNYMEEIEKESSKNVEDVKGNIEIETGAKKPPFKGRVVDKEILRSPKVIHKKEISPLSINTSDSNKFNEDYTNQESIVDKIFRLTGYQKTLFNLITEKCFSRGKLSTGVINKEAFIEALKTSSNMLKTTIVRLIEKGLITRENGKRGRGGFYCFSISESVRAGMMEYKRLILTDNFLDSKKESIGYREIFFNDKQTNSVKNQLPVEWENIDITPLQSIGFSKTHLFQVAGQNKLSPDDVQTSIYAFAFDLDENDKRKTIKGDPINFFMGIVRNGKPYVPPSNYESPQDKSMRLYLEQMRIIEQRRVDMEREAFELAFRDWFSSLSEEEIVNFLPDVLKHFKNATMREAQAKEYFKKEIWSKQLAYGKFLEKS